MQQEFLLEIGVEEIPAGYIRPALKSLQEGLVQKLADFRLGHGEIRVAATPRRLAVCIKELDAGQADHKEEFIGPSKQAAFDNDGNPTRAAHGFAASKGASVEDLQVVSTPKGEYVMLVQEVKGEPTEKLLAGILPDIILSTSFAKSMRWGNGRHTFARPIHWLVAIFGGKVVPFSVGDIKSGSTSKGHRFMNPQSFEVSNFDDYLAKLHDHTVIGDLEERKEAVLQEVQRVAAAAGGTVLADDELLETVTNLVEYPHGICGTFDRRFLDLPDDVLITSMREHQKYFCIADDKGRLQANFVAVNNTGVADEKLAAEGHQRVLRARLEDGYFFFREDQKRSLADRVDDLTGIIFQSGLGTMKEKTDRLVQLVEFLARKIAPRSCEQAKRAALLCKADLLTDMVNEFPSLQGVMGREYALLDGEEKEVAVAILEHYQPVRAGGQLPEGVVGALVGMADRLDSICGCFGIGKIPTGTADPYGLRRLSLGLLHIIEKHSFVFSLQEVVKESLHLYGDRVTVAVDEAAVTVMDFIKGRFVNDQVSRTIAQDAVEAVTSVSFDDILDCTARINALVTIRRQPSFDLLAAAFKRIMNIIKDNTDTSVDEALFSEEAEKELFTVFQSVMPDVRSHLDAKEYVAAMENILRMKEPVDTFFDKVMVMADDPAVRSNRLNLLTAIAMLFLKVGDFSRMQGAVGNRQ
jgi:glycyl-tRNA synthetase beta chain